MMNPHYRSQLTSLCTGSFRLNPPTRSATQATNQVQNTPGLSANTSSAAAAIPSTQANFGSSTASGTHKSTTCASQPAHIDRNEINRQFMLELDDLIREQEEEAFEQKKAGEKERQRQGWARRDIETIKSETRATVEATEITLLNSVSVLGLNPMGEADRYVYAVVEGRGNSSREIGVAVLDSYANKIILSQFADDFLYSRLYTKFCVYSPSRVIVPRTTEQNEVFMDFLKMLNIDGKCVSFRHGQAS